MACSKAEASESELVDPCLYWWHEKVAKKGKASIKHQRHCMSGITQVGMKIHQCSVLRIELVCVSYY